MTDAKGLFGIRAGRGRKKFLTPRGVTVFAAIVVVTLIFTVIGIYKVHKAVSKHTVLCQGVTWSSDAPRKTA